jgi:hypothetical protein
MFCNWQLLIKRKIARVKQAVTLQAETYIKKSLHTDFGIGVAFASIDILIACNGITLLHPKSFGEVSGYGLSGDNRNWCGCRLVARNCGTSRNAGA